MKVRDLAVGFIFLVILIAGILWIYKIKSQKTVNQPLPTPNISARITNTFPNLKIPDGAPRAELRDVSGGDNIGVATKTEVVANLPELTSGKNYQVLLENGEGKTVLLGNLKVSKSGWILEYNSDKYPGYNKVIVVQGSVRLLEGSF